MGEQEVNKGMLSERDHHDLQAFLGHVLDMYKRGDKSKQDLVLAMAHVISSIDERNMGEARSWLGQGRGFLQEQG